AFPFFPATKGDLPNRCDILTASAESELDRRVRGARSVRMRCENDRVPGRGRPRGPGPDHRAGGRGAGPGRRRRLRPAVGGQPARPGPRRGRTDQRRQGPGPGQPAPGRHQRPPRRAGQGGGGGRPPEGRRPLRLRPGRGGGRRPAGAGVPLGGVPGVTSAVAVPAYAGLPVTYRGLASSFTIVTGQEGEAGVPVDWEALSRVGGTVAVLMGVAKRAEIARRLMAGGLPPDTPVAAVTWGTRPEQRTVRTTLGRLGDTPIDSPAVLLVGAVATLDLPWYESRPLFGRRIVVTRAREQASGLVERLDELWAATVELPVIEIVEPADGGAALREAARRVGDYDWVAFTSANAVTRFFAALGDVGADTRALGGRRVAAIGPGTAEALAGAGVRADLVPERFVAESLLEAFPPGPGRVLLPRAAVARDALPAGLAGRGFTVDVVEAYRTVVGRPAPEALAAAGGADAVTFTSSSTVTNYLAV